LNLKCNPKCNMLGNNRRYWTVVSILALAAVCVIGIRQARSSVSPQADLSRIPLQISSWEGKELEIEENIYESLETRDIIIRRYDKNKDSIYLTVVFSGENRHSFHPPELCYLGGGEVKLIGKGREAISLGADRELLVNKLVMQTGPIKTQAWYWFAASDRFVSSYYLQQAYLMLNALRARPLNGALIRVSAVGNSQLIEPQAKEFIRDIYPHLEEVFKNL
jgi:EpsI family protein